MSTFIPTAIYACETWKHAERIKTRRIPSAMPPTYYASHEETTSPL